MTICANDPVDSLGGSGMCHVKIQVMQAQLHRVTSLVALCNDLCFKHSTTFTDNLKFILACGCENVADKLRQKW